MNNTAKLVIAGLTAALAYDTWASFQNKKIDQRNKARYERLQTLLDSSLSREAYLAQKLDDNEIPFTEFDQVVYHAL